MKDEHHFRKLERMYLSAPINEFYSPSISISQGQASIETEVKSELFHAAGSLHGSVYFKLLDDAAFFAVNSLVRDVFILTVSFNIYLTRQVTQGVLVARGSGSFLRSKVALAGVKSYR